MNLTLEDWLGKIASARVDWGWVRRTVVAGFGIVGMGRFCFLRGKKIQFGGHSRRLGGVRSRSIRGRGVADLLGPAHVFLDIVRFFGAQILHVVLEGCSPN